MMNEIEYITVSEFAKRTSISKQAVYSRLDKGLKQFVKVVDGQKMIDIKALELYENGSKSNTSCSYNNQLGTTNKMLDTLTDVVNELKEQLIVKDKQIEFLSKSLEISQQQASTAQALHAGTLQQSIEDGKKHFGFFKKK